MRMIDDDWGDGVDDNGGVPRTVKKTWLDINWAFPANAPAPASFTVVVFTGTDPTNTANYLFQPVVMPSTDRRLVKAISPNISVANINAAVRADYA